MVEIGSHAYEDEGMPPDDTPAKIDLAPLPAATVA
jgi:hypothetical protein